MRMRTIKHTHRLAAVIAALSLAVTAAGYGPMSSQHFNIPWSTIATGGERMASPQFSIVGTVGAAANAGASHSTHFTSGAGFWARQVLLSHTVFLPVVVKT